MPIAARFSDQMVLVFPVILALLAVAGLMWVAVWVPVAGTGLVGCLLGFFGGMVTGVAIYSSPGALVAGAMVGAGTGLALGLALGAVVMHFGTRKRDLLARWFLLAEVIGGGVAAWAIGMFWMVMSMRPLYGLGLALSVGVVLGYLGGIGLESRFPTLALMLLLGLDGFALGMFAGGSLIRASWGVEAGAVVGVTVGLVQGLLIGWHHARRPSAASSLTPA